MIRNWEHNIDQFISSAQRNGVRMLMVGGGAVNFHGYQRHSADVDFWIETTPENFNRLVIVFQELGYEIDAFPQSVLEGNQNISIKFSPEDLDLELITRFSVNKTFEEAYHSSELVVFNQNEFLQWNVLSLDDLITSKLKAGRPKDLFDVHQLRQLNP